MEKPKRLYFELFQAKGASCIRTVQTGRNGLTGKGILTGVVDSGVDYFHPDFRNADGSSRILRLWDQSIQGNPPQGYVTGTEYTKRADRMRRLHLEKTRAGALFHLWITVDMEPQCWESRQEMGELPMESIRE